MATDKEKMTLYDFWRTVPSEAQKSFNNGRFSGTDINPMWRIKKLTEALGPCGIGWYYEVLSERCENHGDADTIAIVDINLYIKVDGEWSKPIYGTGGNVIKRVDKYGKVSVSDEGYKMALTDAISVAAKQLGIGADIYFANDRTKYTDSPLKAENRPSEPQKSWARQIDADSEKNEGRPLVERILACERCNKVLTTIKTASGTDMTPQDLANYSAKKTGGRLFCPDCLKAWVKEQKGA